MRFLTSQMNYYNEHDPKAAAWLRELIAQGLIPTGDVDERSIVEIKPHEIARYTQCHWFAGIAGWSFALQLAGWPEARPVWTGSCPCQPFSSAGQQKGQADARHLWPVFFNLIRECRPEHIFGEQVASAIGHGWLDGVSADLESEGYACGAVVFGAHSVGAPHIRQRLYWMANANSIGIRAIVGSGEIKDGTEEIGRDSNRRSGDVDECCTDGWSNFSIVHCRDGKARRLEPESFPLAHGIPGRVGLLRGYGNAIVPQVAAEFIRAFLDAEQDLTK